MYPELLMVFKTLGLPLLETWCIEGIVFSLNFRVRTKSGRNREAWGSREAGKSLEAGKKREAEEKQKAWGSREAEEKQKAWESREAEEKQKAWESREAEENRGKLPLVKMIGAFLLVNALTNIPMNLILLGLDGRVSANLQLAYITLMEGALIPLAEAALYRKMLGLRTMAEWILISYEMNLVSYLGPVLFVLILGGM